MNSFKHILFFAIAMGLNLLLQGAPTDSEAVSDSVRETRTIHKKRLCRKYGICEGHGGYGGYQGQQGYGGHGGYPINIAISQSQASANEGGGGYGSGHYPNNYQYNGGYPNHGYGGYNQGYGGYSHGYGGYNKPYYGNGQGSFNSQFNGNYNGGGNGGYGHKPYGGYYDEDSYDGQEDYGYERSSGIAAAGAYAEAGRKND